MRLRIEWIKALATLVIGLIVVAWCSAHVDPACSFDEFANRLNVHDVEEYRQLVMLGIVGTVLVLIGTLFKSR